MVDSAKRNEKDSGVRTVHRIKNDCHSEFLSRFSDGDAAIYRYLSFDGEETEFICQAASYLAVTCLELRLDQLDGPLIGTCEIGHSGGWEDWKEYRCTVNSLPGVHALYLLSKDGGAGSRLCDLKEFCFQ